MKSNKSSALRRYQEAKELLLRGQVSPTEGCHRLFALGYELDHGGEHDEADSLYQQTIDLLEDLSAQPGSSLTDASLAELAIDHGKALVKIGKFRSAISAFKRALEVVDTWLGSGTNSILLEKRAIILGWLALAKRKSGVLDEAVDAYEDAITLWKQLPDMINAPTSPYDGFLGACYLGASKSLAALGENARAMDYRRKADQILEAEFEASSKLQ